jgi:hypothetical protein
MVAEFYREFSVIASAATKVFVPRARRSALPFAAWCAAEPGPIGCSILDPGSALRFAELVRDTCNYA